MNNNIIFSVPTSNVRSHPKFVSLQLLVCSSEAGRQETSALGSPGSGISVGDRWQFREDYRQSEYCKRSELGLSPRNSWWGFYHKLFSTWVTGYRFFIFSQKKNGFVEKKDYQNRFTHSKHDFNYYFFKFVENTKFYTRAVSYSCFKVQDKC